MNEPDDFLQYPIGGPQLPNGPLTAAERTALIQQIAELPAQLTAAAKAVGGVGLEQPYRPGGWNGRQVIHHVADSHMNAYVRFRLALTEDNPTIRPYEEKAWAELPDVAATPVTVSLTLLEALHTRFVTLLHHLTDEQWQRTFYHPGNQRTSTLDQTLALYAWHGRHHLGHLKSLITADLQLFLCRFQSKSRLDPIRFKRRIRRRRKGHSIEWPFLCQSKIIESVKSRLISGNQ